MRGTNGGTSGDTNGVTNDTNVGITDTNDTTDTNDISDTNDTSDTDDTNVGITGGTNLGFSFVYSVHSYKMTSHLLIVCPLFFSRYFSTFILPSIILFIVAGSWVLSLSL